jgi:hypothetical protein
LNIAQKDFHVKILDNRRKFLQIQNKIDRFFNDIENNAYKKREYHKKQEIISQNTDNNKLKHLSNLKTKAQKVVINSQAKNEAIQQFAKEREEELYEKSKEIINQNLLIIQKKEEEELKKAERRRILDEENRKKLEIKELVLYFFNFLSSFLKNFYILFLFLFEFF